MKRPATLPPRTPRPRPRDPGRRRDAADDRASRAREARRRSRAPLRPCPDADDPADVAGPELLDEAFDADDSSLDRDIERLRTAAWLSLDEAGAP